MPTTAVTLELAARRRAIFACCRDLGIDDVARKALLRNLVGVDSSTQLTLGQADRVLEHLHRRGARKAANAGAPKTLDKTPAYRKIGALLADMLLPWAYADKIAENISGGKAGGIPRLVCVRDAQQHRAVIAALMVEKTKRLAAAWQQLDARLAERGLDRDWCAAQAEQLGRKGKPWPWAECLQTLRLIEAKLP